MRLRLFDKDEFKDYDIELSECIIVNVDREFNSSRDLFMHYGWQVYGNGKESLNPIAPGSVYFGDNFDGFNDCLHYAPGAVQRHIISLHDSSRFQIPASEVDIYFMLLKDVTNNLAERSDYKFLYGFNL